MPDRRKMYIGAGVIGASGGTVTYSISGTVYDADGSTPVSDVTVALGWYTATSAANGTYTISGIPAGVSGNLTGSKTGYAWVTVAIASMSGNLTGQDLTPAITLLFADRFTTLDATPLATPRNAEPGPGQWETGNDTAPSLNITGGALNFAAAATSNPRLQTVTQFTRAAGIAQFCDITVTDTNGAYLLNDVGNSIRVSSNLAQIANPNGGSSPGINGSTYTRNRMGFIYRASGAIYIFNNRIIFATASSSSNIKAIIDARAGNVGADVDEVRVGQLASWDETGLQVNKVASPSNGEVMVGSADGFLEFTWQAATGETLDLQFRRTDDDNCWIVRCDQTNSKVYLYEKVTGTETERGATGGVAQTFTNGSSYQIAVQKFGQAFVVNVAGVVKINYGSATFNETETGVKVTGFTTGSNLVQWLDDIPTAVENQVNAMFPARRNASAALTTPTYDESGQAVHPDVVLAPNGVSWNGYKYWMVMTPYPAADSTKENPSIIVSNDKTTWVEPAGISNPISGTLGAGEFYSDGCLIFDPTGTTLWCFYRWSNGTDTSKVYVRSSTDGVTWSNATEILTGSNLIYVSPTVVHDGTNYVMWVVDSSTATPLTIVKRTCSTPDGTWSAGSNCTTANVRAFRDIWHIFVKKVGSTYYMLAPLSQPGSSGDTDLFMATSTDQDAWTFDPEMVVWRGELGNWDEERIYRACGLSDDGTDWDIWYSGRTTSPTVWHIGYTTFKRS